MVATLEVLSGRSKEEYAKEVQSAAEDPDVFGPVVSEREELLVHATQGIDGALVAF